MPYRRSGQRKLRKRQFKVPYEEYIQMPPSPPGLIDDYADQMAEKLGLKQGKKRKISAGKFGSIKEKAGVHATPDGTGGTYTMYVHNNKYQRLPPVGQSLVWTGVGSSAIHSGTGQVKPITVNTFMNITELNKVAVTASGEDTATQRTFFKSLSAKTTYQNMAPDNCELWLYDVIAKKGSQYDDPVVALRDSIDAEGGTSTDYLVPGWHLMNSAIFRDNFQIVNHRKSILGAGRQYVHNFRHNINGWYDKQDSSNLNTTRAYLTSFQVVFIRGHIIQDSTTNTQISYGSAKVAQITEWRINAVSAADLRRVSTTVSGLTNPTVSGQSINPNTGAILADVVTNEAGAQE